MKYIIDPFKRLGLLLIILIWVSTIGFIGVMLWMPILIIFGQNTSDEWMELISKTGEPLISAFENIE